MRILRGAVTATALAFFAVAGLSPLVGRLWFELTSDKAQEAPEPPCAGDGGSGLALY